MLRLANDDLGWGYTKLRDAHLDAHFRRRAKIVAATGFRILGRRHEVEDLVQEVLVDTCRDLSQLPNPDALLWWPAACTVGRALTRVRARGLQITFPASWVFSVVGL